MKHRLLSQIFASSERKEAVLTITSQLAITMENLGVEDNLRSLFFSIFFQVQDIIENYSIYFVSHLHFVMTHC